MRAIVINKDDAGQTAKVADVNEADLPEGDVLVKVDYSTMNFKDSMAITGAPGIIRSFPMIPGVDIAGTVEESTSDSIKQGDRVVLNGWGVGEGHWGGLAEKARLKSEWLVPLPDAFSTKQAMAIGTAGYTAMLCVMALEDHGVTPDQGEILVTGAAGGVGSVAISLLAKLGYTVVASTGRPEQADYLKSIGATDTIDRYELSEPGRPMGRERWAGAVDAVGSHTLANICATMKYGGTVAACGLAQGPDLKTTVLPFILRSVTLAGVDSVNCPLPRRIEAWNRLAQDLDIAKLELMTTEISLAEAIPVATQQMAGQTRGRIVVDVNR